MYKNSLIKKIKTDRGLLYTFFWIVDYSETVHFWAEESCILVYGKRQNSCTLIVILVILSYLKYPIFNSSSKSTGYFIVNEEVYTLCTRTHVSKSLLFPFGLRATMGAFGFLSGACRSRYRSDAASGSSDRTQIHAQQQATKNSARTKISKKMMTMNKIFVFSIVVKIRFKTRSIWSSTFSPSWSSWPPSSSSTGPCWGGNGLLCGNSGSMTELELPNFRQ